MSPHAERLLANRPRSLSPISNMFDRPLSPGDVERIRRERREADARYNDALTRLDRAVARPSLVPEAPPLPDEEKVAAINESWRILGGDAVEHGAGWRARVAAFVWRLVGPLFQRQEHFNACVVDHLNRSVAGERQARETLAHALVLLRDQLAALATFESRLIQFLQQITAYVDTKDQDLASAILQDPHQQLAVLEKSIALIQQQQVALKRELASFAGAAPPGSVPTATEPRRRSADAPSTFGAANAYKYLCFEAEFRGAEDSIRRRFDEYGRYFAGASDVLDVGCGRGEFLDLLRGLGVPARGIDINRDMVEQCRSRGLNVAEADAVTYLEGIADGSLGGLFAAQVVEHLESAHLVRFLELAYEKLRPGSKIVLETINVDCWSAFFGPYLRDITHAHPLPSDTLKFLLQASGFQRLQVVARSPVGENLRLRRVSPEAATMMSSDVVAVLNANTDRLNSLLFTYLDYAIVGERL